MSEQAGVIPEWHVGDRMAKALTVAKVSRNAMAEYMDVAPNTLLRWTTGVTPVKRSTLRLWALRTGVSLEWLETGKAPTAEGGEGLSYTSTDSNREPAD